VIGVKSRIVVTLSKKADKIADIKQRQPIMTLIKLKFTKLNFSRYALTDSDSPYSITRIVENSHRYQVEKSSLTKNSNDNHLYVPANFLKRKKNLNNLLCFK